MAIFTGAGVAIVTPFKENGEVNYDKLGELIDWQVENGTDSIVIVGTTGEASTLTHEEHVECIRYAVQKTAKRVPVVAGTGSNCTETAIYLTKEAEKAGADGALVVLTATSVLTGVEETLSGISMVSLESGSA